jgi:hypothetical protein
MWKIAPALAFAAVVALAQSQSSKNGSIGGVVRDTGTGTPIAEVVVSVTINSRYANGTIYTSSDSKTITVLTDAQGRYRLSDLPAGVYRVWARSKDLLGASGAKMVNLRSGQDLASIDFSFAASGSITGRVLDQNREPIPGASVHLVSKEYSSGGVAYLVRDVVRADDQGAYALRRVAPGRSFLLMAANRTAIPPISETPADLKLRKPSFVPTYYPSAGDPEGAAPVVLGAGERREGVDLLMLRAPSYCIEGRLQGSAGPVPSLLMIAGQELGAGIASGGGAAMLPPSTDVGTDGKFRVCGLRAGNYKLMAYSPSPPSAAPSAPPQFGTLPVTISDKDVAGLLVVESPGLPLKGTVEWAGAPLDPPLTARLSVYLRNLSRSVSMQGEPQTYARSEIPGEFSIPTVLVDEYRVATNLNAPGVYVKDITYGGASVLYAPLRAGSSANNELRVVLARDGGSIAVKVAGKDGNAAPHVNVVIFPAGVPSEAALAERMVIGEADQNGNYSYGVLAPGKYFVLATTTTVDRTVESIGKLWGARTKAKDVELAPNASAQVTLEPSRID